MYARPLLRSSAIAFCHRDNLAPPPWAAGSLIAAQLEERLELVGETIKLLDQPFKTLMRSLDASCPCLAHGHALHRIPDCLKLRDLLSHLNKVFGQGIIEKECRVVGADDECSQVVHRQSSMADDLGQHLP